MQPAWRAQVTAQYREHIDLSLGGTLPAASSAAELIALVKTLRVPEFEAGNGWESKPPFPGLSETPEAMGTGWRMICACRVYDRDNQELIVVYSTFVSGRRAGVVVNAPGTAIPEEYLPVASR